MYKTEIKQEHIDRIKELIQDERVDTRLITAVVSYLFLFISSKIRSGSNIPIRLSGFGTFKKKKKMSFFKTVRAILDSATSQVYYVEKDIEALKEARKEICMGCPLLKDISDVVIGDESFICDDTKEYQGIKGCGCALFAKWKQANATCPRGLWEEVEVEYINNKTK